MNEERLQADEYEKQYYGFSSTELYEDFKEQVYEAIKMSLLEMERAFKEQLCDKALRDKKLVEIYTTYVECAKGPLEKFKNEARKILAIPRNIILDADNYNTSHHSDEDIIQLQKEVAELEKELLQEQVFLAKCQQQKEIMDTVIKPLYEKGNCTIKFLKNLQENLETNNNEKVMDLHESCVQYYFNNNNAETDDPELWNVKRRFVKNV